MFNSVISIKKISSANFESDPTKILTGNIGGGNVVTNISDLSNINSMLVLVGYFFNIIMGLGVAVIFVNIGLAFINYITASGDPKSLDKANKHLAFSFVALFVVLLSWGIRTGIIYTVGLSSIDIFSRDAYLDPDAPEGIK